MHVERKQIVTNGSLGADLVSIGMPIDQMQFASIQAEWTGGTAAGTLKIQISNDIVTPSTTADPGANVVNWSDWTGSSTTVAGAGNFGWNVESGYSWVRLVFTRSGGTGTLNAIFTGKG